MNDNYYVYKKEVDWSLLNQGLVFTKSGIEHSFGYTSYLSE